LKALPPGSRFGGGRSGELDDGETDSVHFFVREQESAEAESCRSDPPPWAGADP